MKLTTIASGISLAVLLSACAQQETATAPPIGPEPMFDKYGGGTCEEGYSYVPGATPQQALCVPEDCEATFNADGSPAIVCPPPRPGRDPDDSSDGGNRVPGTAPRDPAPAGSSVPGAAARP